MPIKPPYPGLHTVRVTQKNGTQRSYYYAWRGGPKLFSPFGSSEFLIEFNLAIQERDRITSPAETGTLAQIVSSYLSSPDYLSLSSTACKDYRLRLDKILARFGDLPIEALDDPSVRTLFIDWRDEITRLVQATNLDPDGKLWRKYPRDGTREADYCISTLKILLNWAHDRRLILSNQAEKISRLHNKTRVDAVWSDAQIGAIRAKCSGGTLLAVELAVETGQRQSDILALRWSHYTGHSFRFVQSKTSRPVEIPATQRIQAILAQEIRQDTCPWICHTREFKPYSRDGFRTNFHRAKEAAGIDGLTFHDFRGTTVTRLAEAGATIPQIAAITGHSIASAEAVLQRHYLSQTQKLAFEGVRLLEQHRLRSPI